MRRVLPGVPDDDREVFADESELPDDLEVLRLEDLPGTLRGAPPRMVHRPPRFELLGALRRNLLQATLLSIVPIIGCLAATTVLWIGSGAVPVRQGASATRTAEAAYHQALYVGTQPVLTELASLGAPVDQVEVVYFAWVDAPDGQERAAADTLLEVLSGQAVAVRAVHGPRGGAVAQRLAPIHEARRATVDAYGAWSDAASTLSGRAAVLVGIADGPPDAMEGYAEPL